MSKDNRVPELYRISTPLSPNQHAVIKKLARAEFRNKLSMTLAALIQEALEARGFTDVKSFDMFMKNAKNNREIPNAPNTIDAAANAGKYDSMI